MTIVSLGTDAGDLTISALREIQAADEVVVRTECPAAETLKQLGIAYSTLDSIYEKSRNYDTAARNILKELKARAKKGRVVYCVEGGVREDVAARMLIEGGAPYIDGRSKAQAFASRAGCDEYTARSAFGLTPPFSLPLVVYDLTRDNVSDVKLLLSEYLGDEAPCKFIDGSHVRDLKLYEIDRIKDMGGMCGLAVPKIPLLEKKRFGFDDVVEILKRLRAPDGCPWDKVQTHESIRINAIEEAYELVDAIDLKDAEKMREETGDVLMQALFHTLIEEEREGFTVTDMLTALAEKLITRHTHVFGQDSAAGADGALSVWERNKMKEKHQTTYSDAVNDVPACFPALLRAQKIAKRMEKGGWDKASFAAFEEKFRAEYAELREAYAAGGNVAEELGDVLFSVVELARAVGGDAEMSLLDAVKKMQKRYTLYESLVRADGKDPTRLTEAERDAYYGKAKDAARA